jgi:hypothetical protein
MPVACAARTRDGAKKGKSNVTMSPARLPGIGISRALSGLSRRSARAATSSRTAASASTVMSPGSGTVQPSAVRFTEDR